MSLSYLRVDGHKQAVTHIREPGDSNRCTPYKGNLTNTPHASHAWSAYGLDHMYLTRFMHSNLSLATNSVGQSHYSWETRLPTTFPTRWLTDPYVWTQFPLNQRRSGESQASVDGMLLGLMSPYLWYAIKMFNTCSWGPTHRSLTDTDGGYSFWGAGFPHHTLRPSQPMVCHFPPKGLVWSQVNHPQPKPLVK
jgi:hypothetical protein